MTLDENKLEILRRVEQGTLTIEEASHLLEILEMGDPSPKSATTEDESSVIPSPVTKANESADMAVPTGWRFLWGILLWLGIAFMGLTGFWLYSSYARSGLGVGFWFALFFLLISSAITALGLQLINSRWMLLKIRSDKSPNQHFNVWAPLPLNLVRWFVVTFDGGPYADKRQKIKNAIDDLEKSLGPNEPFVIEIDGDKGYSAKFNVEF